MAGGPNGCDLSLCAYGTIDTKRDTTGSPSVRLDAASRSAKNGTG
jgi:hypothetical protein